MILKNIPFGKIDEFNTLVEISKGSQNKYEYNEEFGAMELDWVFTGDFCFPFNYGLIPQTLGGDDDHADTFVLTDHPIEPGVVVKCQAIGVIELLDRGEEDNKILAVALADQEYKKYQDLGDLPFDYKTIFEKFFKELGIQKSKIIEIKDFHGKDRAIQEISKYLENFKKKS